MAPAFERWLDRFAEPDGAGLCVGVELKGERIFEASHGLANVEWRASADGETIFRIASLTKQFTAAAIVRLVEDGILGLDDLVDRHLPAFGPADGEIIPHRASGYIRTPSLRNAPPLAMTNPHGAGGLGSSAGDLLDWSRALREGKVVSPAGYRAMIEPGKPRDGKDLTRGFGLFRHIVRDDFVIAHSGGIFGFRSHLAHWPAHDLTVVTLANSNPFPVEQVAYGLARRALGQEDAAPVAIEPNPGALAAGAGRFVFPNTEVLDLAPAKGGLGSSLPASGSLYRPCGEDRYFLAQDPEVTFRFTGEDRSAVVFQDYRSPMVGTRAG